MTYCITIKNLDGLEHLLLDFIGNYSISGIEEKENALSIYSDNKTLIKEIQNDLRQFFPEIPFDFDVNEYEEKNWNAIWEQNYQPVIIDQFCLIYAPFHKNLEKNDFDYALEIMPQMSFGTGHHETTTGVIKLMKQLNFQSKDVLDYGAGTAILGILAEKLGAKKVLAIDNDPNCIINGNENAERNNCQITQFQQAESLAEESTQYDIILCNITRNIILKELPHLLNSMKSNAHIIFSGYILEDRGIIESAASKIGLELIDSSLANKWCAQLYRKAP